MKTELGLILLFVGLGTAACANVKPPTSGNETDVAYAELDGVWVMSDGKTMRKFLNAKDEGGYCMEIRAAEGKARIRFLFSDRTFELAIKKTEGGKFLVSRDSKSRKAVVVKGFSDLLPGKAFYYWHFEDSRPYPNKDNARDGVKERYETLEEAVRGAEKEEEATPINKENPFE